MSNETQINPNLEVQASTVINEEVQASTEINEEVQASTEINEEVQASTEINREVQSSTEINEELLQKTSELQTGVLLLERYKVVSPLDVKTGEADLFLCEWDCSEFVAKLYRRPCGIKEDVVEILKNLNSPHVAKLYDIGIYDGMPFEILPYYKNGSISGQTYSLEQLKKSIIPSINEGLRSLHSEKMFHKDIKPSNLMKLDDESGVAIIDFGISSVTEDGNTVLLTKTGLTPEYSAPEAIQSLFSEESDYYSFGITLFELFTGSTPYQNKSAEEIARYTAVQKLPFPETMPNELKELIQGMTYPDITNRHDKSNPNRRWTYEEVCTWLRGENQVIPGLSTGSANPQMPPYNFLGNEYDRMDTLVTALGQNWEDGKKQLYRGLLSGYFKNFHAEIAGYCMDAEEEPLGVNLSEDEVFWNLLYKLSPDDHKFYWKSKVFASLPALGRDILEKLWKQDNSQYQLWIEILEKKLLAKFLHLKKATNEQIKAISALEASYSTVNQGEQREVLLMYYTMGYLLSGQTTLQFEEVSLESTQELSEYMKTLLFDSFESLQKFCHSMISFNNTLDPQLEAWLIALGKRDELEKWRGHMAIM